MLLVRNNEDNTHVDTPSDICLGQLFHDYERLRQLGYRESLYLTLESLDESIESN